VRANRWSQEEKLVVILADKASKITLRKEVGDLRENKASRVHREQLYSKSRQKRLKSATFINGFLAVIQDYQSPTS
jgi:hypothetical protein